MAPTAARLKRAGKEGDTLVDSAIDALVTRVGPDEALKLFAQLIERDEVPAGVPEIDQYLATATLPPNIDAAQMERAEKFFETYGWTAFTLLGCASLPEGYVVPAIDRVLVTTTELERHVHRRLWETIQFTVDVMQHGGLEPNGPGLKSAQKVRLLHGLVRHLVSRSPSTASASPRSLGDKLVAKEWDPAWGTPVSQLQMAGTVLAFSYVIVRGLDRLGYEGIEKADRDAYMYRWNIVGQVMGVDVDLLAPSFADAAAHFEAIRTPLMAASTDGVALARALVGFMEGHVPNWLPLLKPLPRMLMTELCDAPTMKMLDIRLGWHERLALAPMLQVMRIWGRGDEALMHVTPLRAGTRWLFDQTARQLLSTPRGSQRGNFTVPTALARRWRLPHQ